MKIYHTETQEDYDALMVELKRLGIETLEKRLWKENDNQTVVLVRAIGRYIDNRNDTTFGGLARTLKNYPRVPVTKYKAKAEENMRIYHTETQADYDALMVELEEQGIETLERHIWEYHRGETAVFVHAIGPYSDSHRTDTTYGSLGWAFKNYPDEPITKYKAKVGDKMRFTKENIYRLFGDYRRGKNGINRLDNLESVIMDLDDTSEKVVVPKFVAEWIEWNKQRGVSLRLMLGCYADFCGGEEPDVSSEGLKAVQWYVDNPYKFIQAYEKGYTIEPEQLYYIPLPNLKTTDGIQQVLSQREGDKNYFACRPNDKLKQRYTKEELKRVPEVYKPYAKLIEEEEE